MNTDRQFARAIRKFIKQQAAEARAEHQLAKAWARRHLEVKDWKAKSRANALVRGTV